LKLKYDELLSHFGFNGFKLRPYSLEFNEEWEIDFSEIEFSPKVGSGCRLTPG